MVSRYVPASRPAPPGHLDLAEREAWDMWLLLKRIPSSRCPLIPECGFLQLSLPPPSSVTAVTPLIFRTPVLQRAGTIVHTFTVHVPRATGSLPGSPCHRLWGHRGVHSSCLVLCCADTSWRIIRVSRHALSQKNCIRKKRVSFPCHCCLRTMPKYASSCLGLSYQRSRSAPRREA